MIFCISFLLGTVKTTSFILFGLCGALAVDNMCTGILFRLLLRTWVVSMNFGIFKYKILF